MEETSILHPTTCGFVKVAAYELVSSKCELDEQINSFRSLFDYEIKTEMVRRNFPKIIENVRKIGKRNKEMKNTLLSTFSTQSWKELTVFEKTQHSFSNCQRCMEKFITLLNAFPVNKQARLHSKQKPVDMNELQNKTREIYDNANMELKKTFPGIEFTQAQIKLSELRLQNKPSWREKQKETRKTVQHFKKSVEKHLKETTVLRTFGTELSLSKRNKIRIIESFETQEQCRKRTNNDLEKIAAGKKCKKDHVGTNTSFNEDACINIVESYPDGYEINFSELARTCLVKNKENEVPNNGGQIVKEMLKRKNINLSRFSDKHYSDDNYRRKKRKIEGTDVSMPCDITNADLKKEFQKKVDDGTYNTGEIIVPQIFQKLVLKDNCRTEIENFEIAGRKIPINEIQLKLYTTKKNCYRIFNVSEIDMMDKYCLINELQWINELTDSDLNDLNGMMDPAFQTIRIY